MGVLERSYPVADKTHYTEIGKTSNLDPETWRGAEPHKIPIGRA